MKKINVLIVDDSPDFRESLRAFFEAEGSIEVIGEAEDGESAVVKTGELKPDVVLLDLRMPRVNGFFALQEISKKYPEVKVIVLSVIDERECIREAFNLGAAGYIVKEVNQCDFPEIIRDVMSGKIYVHPLAVNYLMIQLKQADKASLNANELKILELMADGLDDQRISFFLKLDNKELPKLADQILQKLHFTEKVQEIAAMCRSELV